VFTIVNDRVLKLDKQSEEQKDIVDLKLHSFYHYLKSVDKKNFGRWTVINQVVKEVHPAQLGIEDLDKYDDFYRGLCDKYKETFIKLEPTERDSLRVKLDEYKEQLKKAEIVTFLMLNMNLFQLQDIVVAYNAY